VIRKQDLGTILLYGLGFSRIRNAFFRLRRKPLLRIVTFHNIRARDLDIFKKNINFLVRKTNVVSLDDFFAGRLSTKKINTIITFDDGYKSWADQALPFLKKLQAPATFFISSGFVGLPDGEQDDFFLSKLLFPPDLLSEERGLDRGDLPSFAKDGFTVGGHTINHLNLRYVRDAAQIKREIAEDKQKLEEMIAAPIIYFAYPAGGFDNPAIDLAEALKESGYRAAVTTVPGFNHLKADPFALHRELTSSAMPPSVFKARVYGNYDGVRFFKNLFGRVFRRSASPMALS
jgi:peptidoglycan/xylan/chitin deacetylase (PgdA/CDA1 family)